MQNINGVFKYNSRNTKKKRILIFPPIKEIIADLYL